MSYSIIWSPDAILTFEDQLHFLGLNWTEREIKNFKNRVNQYLDILEENPFIGKKTGRGKNMHIGFIVKQVSLIYRVKVIQQEIELVLFVANRQNPIRFRKYKT